MSYKVMKIAKDGFKNAGKKNSFLKFSNAKDYALKTSESCPGVALVVVDSAGRPVFDTVASTGPRYTSSGVPRRGSESHQEPPKRGKGRRKAKQ